MKSVPPWKVCYLAVRYPKGISILCVIESKSGTALTIAQKSDLFHWFNWDCQSKLCLFHFLFGDGINIHTPGENGVQNLRKNLYYPVSSRSTGPKHDVSGANGAYYFWK